MAKVYTFTHGDLVFAKCKGYPPWPARVDINANVGKIGKNRMAVFFFGTHEIGSVAVKDMLPYNEFKDKLGKPQNRKGFVDALWEIEHKPNLTIDGKVTKAMAVGDLKKDRKEVVTRKPPIQKTTYEEVKICPPKSVYSDLDSDSNDLIIDENVETSSYIKPTATVNTKKVASKRKLDEECISRSVQPSLKKVPLRSRKRLKIEESKRENVKDKQLKPVPKKVNDETAVKLKIKIPSKPSVGNDPKWNNVRARTRFESKAKELQTRNTSFERKDYLEDTRERSRHSFLDRISNVTSLKQPEKIIQEDLNPVEVHDAKFLKVDTKPIVLTSETVVQKVGKAPSSKVVSSIKREPKENLKMKVEEVEEPVVTRTRCGRIVRTPAALDRDEEIIDLPGFKRNVNRQIIRKETAASKIELPPAAAVKKKKNVEKKPPVRIERKSGTDLPKSETLNCETNIQENACEPKQKEMPSEPEKKIVMTFARLKKSSKFSAATKRRGAVTTMLEDKSVEGTSDILDKGGDSGGNHVLDKESGDQVLGKESGDQVLGKESGEHVLNQVSGEQVLGKASVQSVLAKALGEHALAIESEEPVINKDGGGDRVEDKSSNTEDKGIRGSNVADKASEDEVVEAAVVKLIAEDTNIEEQAAAAAAVLEEPLEEMFDDSPGELVIVENQEDMDVDEEKPPDKSNESNVCKAEIDDTKSDAPDSTADLTSKVEKTSESVEAVQASEDDITASGANNKEAELEKEKLMQRRRAEKEEEKNRKKREKYEKKKRDKLIRMKVEEKLNAIDHKIKDSLHLGVQDIDQCLEAMIELDTVSLNPSILKSNPYIVVTVRKCRKYKNSGIVRQKADDLYYKFKEMFLGGEGDSFSNLFEKDKSGRTSSKCFSTDTELDTSMDNQDLNGVPVAHNEHDNRLPSLPVGACVPVAGQNVDKTKNVDKSDSKKETTTKSKRQATASAVSNSSDNLRSTSNKAPGTKPKKR